MNESEIIIQQAATIDSLSKQVKLLEEKVVLLLQQLQKTPVKKDSHNSSLPPSSDFHNKNRSLRPPSTLKSGGQIGHKGTNLEMSSEPDKIIDLKSDFCSQCGQSLADGNFVLKAKRQVLEIPPVVPIYEEYRQYACTCSCCKHEQIAEFPQGVNAPIQYGSSVEALVSYFSIFQYLPFARLQNLFSQVFSLPLSQGTVGNILERVAMKCEGVYQIIKTEVAQSEVVGSDETGAKVNGTKWWIWVWQNMLNTFIVASSNRGSETIKSVWANGLPNAFLVVDRWAAQLKTHARGHQLCSAHLLRNIIFLLESEEHGFAIEFKQLLVDVFEIRRKLVARKSAFKVDDKAAIFFEERLNQLLLITIDKKTHPNTAIFQASMIKNRNNLFPCLYNLAIPPDNNWSERAVRNFRVKQKVSGQFKSGQHYFCVIRSVVDTLIKRGLDVLPFLTQIIKLQPK
jgi:transposase